MKRRNILVRLGLGLALVTAPLTALALTVPSLTSAASASPNAEFTTTNVNWAGGSPGNGHCLAPNTGTDPVNCNIYNAKDDVWLNGGPDQQFPGQDGTYFFAVLDPGSQHNPNDGSAGLLSTDSYSAREFTVTSGVVAPVSGSGYNFDATNYKIQLLPFSDTSNPGGVYIAATCYLGPTGGPLSYPVTPSSCKYDMFKVLSSSPTPSQEFTDPTAFKTAAGAFTDTYTWQIQKAVDTNAIDTASSATFNYTVTVTHDAGTPSDPSVSGMIDISNPNFDADFNTLPLQLSGITDQLSDGTTCNVDYSGTQPATSTLDLVATDNFFPYTCTDLVGGYPTSALTNTVTASWDAQTLSTTADDLGTTIDAPAGTAPFTTSGITFTPASVVDNCVTVTDTLGRHVG